MRQRMGRQRILPALLRDNFPCLIVHYVANIRRVTNCVRRNNRSPTTVCLRQPKSLKPSRYRRRQSSKMTCIAKLYPASIANCEVALPGNKARGTVRFMSHAKSFPASTSPSPTIAHRRRPDQQPGCPKVIRRMKPRRGRLRMARRAESTRD